MSLQSAAPPPPAQGDPLTRVSDGSVEFVLSAQWAHPGRAASLFPMASPAAAPGRTPSPPHTGQPLSTLCFTRMKAGGCGEINLHGH